MIFVTVGTQLPFDRLVEAVDRWAGVNPSMDVFVQLGVSSYRPVHCRYSTFVHHRQWERLFAAAQCVVSHAGMGTIIRCLEQGKPLIIMPRLAALGEHRTDHQVVTAARFEHRATVRVTRDECQLMAALDQPVSARHVSSPACHSSRDALVGELRRFVRDGDGTGKRWGAARQAAGAALRDWAPPLGAGLAILWLMHHAGYFALWRESDEYAHGPLVLLVLAYIVYRRREALGVALPRYRWTGPLVAVLALMTAAVGAVSGISLLEMYGVWLFAVAGALTMGGVDLARRLAAVLLIALMVIPLPSGIEPMLTAGLQVVSSELGVSMIRLLGGVVHLEGNIIDVGTTQLLVAEACAGLRYLYPLLSLSALGGYLLNGPWWARIALFISAVPITILMNSLRIAITGLLVQHGGSGHVAGFLHWFEGWVMFAAAFLLLLLVAWLLILLLPGRRSLYEAFSLQAPERPRGDAGGSVERRAVPRPPAGHGMALTLLLMTGALVVTGLSARSEVHPQRQALSAFPLQIGDWQGRPGRLSLLVEEVANASDYFYGDFRSGAEVVNAYVSYYESQLRGAIPHSPEVCLPGDGWVIVSNDPVRIHNSAGEAFEANRLVTTRGNRTVLAYYWLKQGDRRFRDALGARLDLVRSAAFESRTDGALIRLVSELGANEGLDEVDARIGRFAQALTAVLPLYVPD